MEVAHRLSLLEGKCENIHGHSMWVDLSIKGNVNPATGILMDFGSVKKAFRNFLDTNFDHHLLLNDSDILVNQKLPGVMLFPGDPTTENLALWISQWVRLEYGYAYKYKVVVHETAVNAAEWSSDGF